MDSENKHLLHREIKYRARRSIKEMDNLIGAFIASELNALPDELLPVFRDMLNEMDQNLLASWQGEKEIPAEYAEIFMLMKKFHEAQ